MSERVELSDEALSRLRDWGGDALLSKMVELFLANTPERVEQIRNGIAQRDAAEVERGAHSLKSTSANLGAMALSELAARIEGRASAGESGALEELLPQLEAEYARAREAVAALRS